MRAPARRHGRADALRDAATKLAHPDAAEHVARRVLEALPVEVGGAREARVRRARRRPRRGGPGRPRSSCAACSAATGRRSRVRSRASRTSRRRDSVARRALTRAPARRGGLESRGRRARARARSSRGSRRSTGVAARRSRSSPSIPPVRSAAGRCSATACAWASWRAIPACSSARWRRAAAWAALAVHTAQVCDVARRRRLRRACSIETVGVGQSELEIAQTADSTAGRARARVGRLGVRR